jgi:hypothetical protein
VHCVLVVRARVSFHCSVGAVLDGRVAVKVPQFVLDVDSKCRVRDIVGAMGGDVCVGGGVAFFRCKLDQLCGFRLVREVFADMESIHGEVQLWQLEGLGRDDVVMCVVENAVAVAGDGVEGVEILRVGAGGEMSVLMRRRLFSRLSECFWPEVSFLDVMGLKLGQGDFASLEVPFVEAQMLSFVSFQCVAGAMKGSCVAAAALVDVRVDSNVCVRDAVRGVVGERVCRYFHVKHTFVRLQTCGAMTCSVEVEIRGDLVVRELGGLTRDDVIVCGVEDAVAVVGDGVEGVEVLELRGRSVVGCLRERFGEQARFFEAMTRREVVGELCSKILCVQVVRPLVTVRVGVGAILKKQVAMAKLEEVKDLKLDLSVRGALEAVIGRVVGGAQVKFCRVKFGETIERGGFRACGWPDAEVGGGTLLRELKGLSGDDVIVCGVEDAILVTKTDGSAPEIVRVMGDMETSLRDSLGMFAKIFMGMVLWLTLRKLWSRT